jgi:predicted phage terminase large subunit-like protein
VVAIDPNASSEEDSNECGIICAGLGADGHGYVLDDLSGVMAPYEWAMTAISLLHERMVDRIIAETNNGGEMVEHTLRMVDPSIPFSAVWASRGKVTRAEPISALYEQGRVHHVGAFPRLEDQMCAFTVDFNRTEMGYSPDRVDALVWALTELMIEGGNERRLLFA